MPTPLSSPFPLPLAPVWRCTSPPLLASGTTVAYAASIVSTVKTGGESFFETSALLITFVVLGKLLETMAKARTTSALLKLLDMQPRGCGERMLAGLVWGKGRGRGDPGMGCWGG
jgi:hypothetical protein